MNSRLALVENRRLFVFTDLDGTLLDPVGYDWRAAASTLDYLRERNILLIPCTSKTRAEVEALRRKIRHNGPYIAENGGILVLPWTFLGRERPRQSSKRDLVLHLGGSYSDVCRALAKLSRRAKVSVRSFRQMTATEIARATGLTPAQARKAKLRETSEPFQFLNASATQIREFRRVAKDHGFHVAEGARFWHLTIGADKGQTMGVLLQLAQIIAGARVLTIAAGDASIDLPMLQQADLAILMPGREGRFDSRMVQALPNAMLARAAGPEGWSEAVLRAISLCEQRAPRLFESPPAFKSPRPAATANAQPVLAPPEVFPSPARAPQVKPRAPRKKAASL